VIWLGYSGGGLKHTASGLYERKHLNQGIRRHHLLCLSTLQQKHALNIEVVGARNGGMKGLGSIG